MKDLRQVYFWKAYTPIIMTAYLLLILSTRQTFAIESFKIVCPPCRYAMNWKQLHLSPSWSLLLQCDSYCYSVIAIVTLWLLLLECYWYCYNIIVIVTVWLLLLQCNCCSLWYSITVKQCFLSLVLILKHLMKIIVFLEYEAFSKCSMWTCVQTGEATYWPLNL